MLKAIFPSSHNAQKLTAHFLLWILVAVLLSAQLVGFSHRIAHAKQARQVSGTPVTLAFDQDGIASVQDVADLNETVRHSCLLFDAATITDCVQHTLTLLVPQQLLTQYYLPTQALLWLASTRHVFEARAPPF